jgi:pyruvate dehydrogenase E2 component (dihydrolipoamide acetyltransferase)
LIEFKFPDVGEGIAEGDIVKWLVKEGDTVKADQNIVQVETDKAVADIPSPVSGKILKINFQEGETVKVGEVLCVIGEEEEKVEVPKMVGKPVEKAKPEEEKKEENSKETLVEEKEVLHSKPMKSSHEIGVTGKKVVAAPIVRKLARSLNVDLSSIKGSGEAGRILKEDLDSIGKGGGDMVQGKVDKPPGAGERQQTIKVKKKYDQYGYLERIPLKGIRKSIADNMMKSVSGSAQLTAMDDIDVTKLWEVRNEEKKHFEIEGVKLTFLPFIIKACISALKENPILNSTIDDEEILVRKYFNIGIAVETEIGLMVPVIKIAEKKSVAQIAKEIDDLAEKARSRKIDVMDMQGSTFTVTNYGSIGGTYATPILNIDNAGILGIGRIFDSVVLDKDGKVKNKKILPVSLTFDHRILDGAEASRFLQSLKTFLSDPEHLFLELEE